MRRLNNKRKMAELLGVKAKATGIVDFVGAGVVKSFTEPMMAQFVGDGNIVSGTVKGVAAGLITGKGGRLGNIATLAMGVDAGEDIAQGLMNMLSGNGDTAGGDVM